jgi:hypothetical protein
MQNVHCIAHFRNDAWRRFRSWTPCCPTAGDGGWLSAFLGSGVWLRGSVEAPGTRGLDDLIPVQDSSPANCSCGLLSSRPAAVSER